MASLQSRRTRPVVKPACAVAMMLFVAACGSNSSTPLTPTPAPTPNMFTLNGQVTDSVTGKGISGATVSIADGPNAGKATGTDASGDYALTGLQQSGFTVNVSASNYSLQSKGVTLTSNETLSFQLAALFADVAGNWSGTFQATTNSGQGNAPITMSLTQVGSTVSGTWAVTSGYGKPNGLVAGTTTANSYSGTFTYNATTSTGSVCTGTIPVSGTAGGTALTWTSPGVVSNCTNLPTQITISVVLVSSSASRFNGAVRSLPQDMERTTRPIR